MQSSFLWGYTFSSILGGVLADRYGGKRVMAWGVAVWSLATLLTPWAADHSTGMLLAARALFGLAEGVALPSMNTLLSRLDFKTLTTPSLFSILLYLLLSHYIISYLDRHTHTLKMNILFPWGCSSLFCSMFFISHSLVFIIHGQA